MRNGRRTQELPHDGVALLQGLGTLGGVEHQPIDDVDLLTILLFSAESQKERERDTHTSTKSSVTFLFIFLECSRKSLFSPPSVTMYMWAGQNDISQSHQDDAVSVETKTMRKLHVYRL